MFALGTSVGAFAGRQGSHDAVQAAGPTPTRTCAARECRPPRRDRPKDTVESRSRRHGQRRRHYAESLRGLRPAGGAVRRGRDRHRHDRPTSARRSPGRRQQGSTGSVALCSRHVCRPAQARGHRPDRRVELIDHGSTEGEVTGKGLVASVGAMRLPDFGRLQKALEMRTRRRPRNPSTSLPCRLRVREHARAQMVDPFHRRRRPRMSSTTCGAHATASSPCSLPRAPRWPLYRLQPAPLQCVRAGMRNRASRPSGSEFAAPHRQRPALPRRGVHRRPQDAASHPHPGHPFEEGRTVVRGP